MKRLLLFLLFLCLLGQSYSQPVIKNKRYPSLLWEISGHGMKKPSFLIGTMHVSNKMAFHLPDSFYYAIRNAQVVALETNPETWQEDMNHYDLGDDEKDFNNIYGSYGATPDDYLAVNTLRFYKYDTKLQRAMFSSPSAINSLLYRTYGNDASDFEEDTYLDMYIFQCGKKWGKRVCGVENYGESMRLMAEAYQDAAKDKNKKERSYNDWDEAYSADKLQEAYRLGNLDLLDSINRYNSTSDAFDEKFLYRRNAIQAVSIDSILRSGSSLFVGVGAAHLPGSRGVIELLRAMGYSLRPVKMGERASREKEQVDRIRVPVVFHSVISEDGAYKVDVPGKLFKSGDDDALDQKQYADMSNGSYYMVSRVMTNAWMWDHSMIDVYNTVDSLLYENIPGKIISKSLITRNGYKGFDITNRTRRGDLQRYNIFITPFEVLFFKMSGNGDYVKNGPEADKFFTSIQLREYKPSVEGWRKFSPSYGGFSVQFPHEPYVGNDGSWIFDAEDKSTNTQYRVIRTDIHNYHFIEEDSFDLGLLNESFLSSEFIDSQLTRKQTTFKGYPALDASFRDKQGELYLARFIIQGPHYYSLVAHGKNETKQMQAFLNSFELKPYTYGAVRSQADTTLYFSVQTPFYPSEKKIRINVPKYGLTSSESNDETSEREKLQNGVYRYKVISNDSTGEKVFVTFFRGNRYHSIKDSLAFENEINANLEDSTCIYRVRKKYRLPNDIRVWETIVSDTNSSRALWARIYYKGGNAFTISTEIDTLSDPSPFISDFFESFRPSPGLEETEPFRKKSFLFFADLSSTDTIAHNRALKHIADIVLDSSDLDHLENAIKGLSWNEKKYLDTKVSLIGKLGGISTNNSADYLERLYYAAGDTAQLQYSALENLLQQQTLYSFRIFGRIMANEPPVLGFNKSEYTSRFEDGLLGRYLRAAGRDNGKFMDELYDTLQLTRAILPELLPLLNLRDYESTMMRILSKMIDSGLVTSVDYESYFGKFYIEAKQEVKRQAIAEKKKSIEKAEKDKSPDMKTSYFGADDDEDEGNSNLNLYASLLLPFASKNPNIRMLITQMLGSQDKRLRYSTMLLLLDRDDQIPDTLISWFAGQEEFQYELYQDLKERGILAKFPSAYNDHVSLGRSALLDRKSYDKPDTLEYVDRRKVNYEGKTGYFYFYRYKTKKDDLAWKLAVAGMTPEDPKMFEFDDEATYSYFNDYSGSSLYDFTTFTNTKLDEEAAIGPQLDKLVKKLLYSRRKSAKEFYPEDEGGGTHDVSD